MGYNIGSSILWSNASGSVTRTGYSGHVCIGDFRVAEFGQ